LSRTIASRSRRAPKAKSVSAAARSTTALIPASDYFPFFPNLGYADTLTPGMGDEVVHFTFIGGGRGAMRRGRPFSSKVTMRISHGSKHDMRSISEIKWHR
jgi:hypothetical protein